MAMTQPSTQKESWDDKQVLQNTIARMATRENPLYPGKTDYILNQEELDRLYDLYRSLVSSAVNADHSRLIQRLENRKQELESEYYEAYGKGHGGSNVRVPSIPEQMLQVRINEIYEVIQIIREGVL